MSTGPEIGVRIQRIENDSIAHEVGLEVGDRLVAVNDRTIVDVLDYRYVSALHDRDVILKVEKASGEMWEVEIEREDSEEIGFELEGIQTRICKNNCIFCFVHQLPRGKQVRRTLRVKDEDFRLSFLFGHYLTLTNLSEADFERIFEQRLSPLYVSVHATEPQLRQYLLQTRTPDDLLGNMRRLIDGGIKLHTQIVLMPGINDGHHLERTISDLLAFHPSVLSVSIVPVGLTSHRKGLPQLQSVDSEYAQETIRKVSVFQETNQRNIGTAFCFLGDEFYILAGQEIPPRSHYGDFPLVENGVGMVRSFMDDFETAMRRRWRTAGRQVSGTVVTGKIFYPILARSVVQMNDKFRLDLRCVPVENLYLGRGITVAGLLSGSDIYAAVKDGITGDFLIVPSESMSGDGGLFLDDWTRADLEKRLQIPVFGGGYRVLDFFKLLFAQGSGPQSAVGQLPRQAGAPTC